MISDAKAEIINKLDKMIDEIVRSGRIPVKTNDKILYKRYTIIEKQDKLYDIIDQNGNVAFSNVFWVNSAMSIVDALSSKKNTKAKMLYSVDTSYAKHVNDMRLYKKMYEYVKDNDTKDIYYSRFIESKCFVDKCVLKINKKSA